MFFSSPGEFALIGLYVLLTILFRRKFNGLSLQLWLLLGNIAILSTLLSPVTLLLHLALSAGVFFYGKVVRRHGSIALLWAGILSLILLFVIRNYPVFEIDFNITDTPNGIINRLGISYILFRHIQYLVDCKKQVKHEGGWLTYINFIVFFPNFLAGPIDKLQNFSRHLHRSNRKINQALLVPGIGRIVIGLIKKYGIVPLFYLEATNYELLSTDFGYGIGIFLSLCLYSLYIYLDFSGYSDIAIGTGFLMGIRTPENFANPYFTSNISDFWKNWHMTFSLFLRENIFMPLVKTVSKVAPRLPRLSVTIMGYLITFGLCGIWHGDTVNFLYWGLWHGVGLIIYKIWSLYVWKDRELGMSAAKRKVIFFLAMMVNFIFVTYGWLFFHYKGQQLSDIVYHIIGLRL